jgi:hypothetical protein
MFLVIIGIMIIALYAFAAINLHFGYGRLL